MKILIVWTHPNEVSLSSAIAKDMEMALTNQGHEVDVIDLYRSGFTPISQQYPISGRDEVVGDDEPVVLSHRKKLDETDALVFIYPVWWWDRPALLKGWFERIFRWGYAIDLTSRGHVARLKGKRAFVIQTCGSSEKSLKEQGAIEAMHGAIASGTLELAGVQVDAIHTFYSVGSLDEKRYEEVRHTLTKIASVWSIR